MMLELSVKKFKANIKRMADIAISEHRAIRVKRRSGKDFVVIGAEDWERDQETLYVLRNKSLMSQLAESLSTFDRNSGYQPTPEQLDAINRI